MGKVVVIGGSAGSLEPLCKVLAKLPAKFPAPVLVVIHVGETANHLPEVLQRCTKLRVGSPGAPETIEPGHVYVAPPNRHLVVRDGCVLATPGPRENRHRPAVDALFRSAARRYRSDVVALVLSGALDDGVAGALAVSVRKGTVVVQDPAEARVPDMPKNVLRRVPTPHCVSVDQIAPLLLRLAGNHQKRARKKPPPEPCDALTDDEALKVNDPFSYTCPECGGAVLKVNHAGVDQFRCSTGHSFSPETFSLAHSEALERALWMALQRLNERRSIHDELSRGVTDPALKRRHQENAAAAAGDMRLLKEILARL